MSDDLPELTPEQIAAFHRAAAVGLDAKHAGDNGTAGLRIALT